MTTVAIMQPTVWPWLGYFDMLNSVDTFVLLDTVPLSPKSWQTRNRIRSRDGNVVWLSIPNHGHRNQPINQVDLADEHGWRTKHLRTLEAAYQHAPHWRTVQNLVAAVYDYEAPDLRLADLTSIMIGQTAELLDIDTFIVRASDLPETRYDKIGRIIDLCHHTNADILLDTPGAIFLNHLTQLEPGLALQWHLYNHPTYTQNGQPFMPYLSILDCLAWHGPDNTAQILKTA